MGISNDYISILRDEKNPISTDVICFMFIYLLLNVAIYQLTSLSEVL